MKFDLHIHESKHSKDSRLELEQIVLEAKAQGLDGIAVTDHDVLGLRSQARFLSARHDLMIFVGVEVSTSRGDILVLGVDELPQAEGGNRLEPQVLIDYVNERGGATIAAHPFRDNGRGLGNSIFELSGLTAIEGYNGRTFLKHNALAVEAASKLGMPVTGGSDAHKPGEVGTYATQVDAAVHSERDLIRALKLGQCHPVSLKSLPVLPAAGLDEDIAV
jgi:predicted metal-dependent phosphoesterase TrpH